MITGSFTEFFLAVHGRAPLAWQAQLAERLARGEHWPEQVYTPLGSGKTTLLDIAVWALAFRAGRSPENQAARRIFFVTYQRAAVPAVYGYAARIEEALARGEAPVLLQVAAALRSLHGREQPLTAARLCGGAPSDDTWARYPDQPLICTATADQVGSRLLFRGYGVSPYQRSIHAALVGMDSLMLIDDGPRADLFQNLTRQLSRFRKPTESLTVVRLALRIPGHPDNKYRKQLEAPKVTTLVEVEASGLVATLTRQVAGLAARGWGGVHGVFVNSETTARAVWAELEERFPGAAILLTGRARLLDWERLRQERRSCSIVVAAGRIAGSPDLDFKSLVTEMAPIEEIQKRFLHLGWNGTAIAGNACIVRVREDKETKEAWQHLCREAQQVGREKVIDLSVTNLARLAEESGPEQAGLQPPVVLAHHVMAWVQTAPTPAIDPAVWPFFHGIRLEEQQASEAPPGFVQLVWRNGIDSAAEASMQMACRPPAAGELLTVPLHEVQTWLRLRQLKSAFCWLGASAIAEVPVLDLRPGSVLLFPASLGGCDRFGWYPESMEPVSDLSEEARQRADAPDEGQLHLHQPEALRRHGEGVAALVQRFARSCGLPSGIISDMVLAAELHDLGLADLRLRLKMQGPAPGWFGDEVCPAGLRHEFLSVAEAAKSGRLQEAVDPELVAHLIGTHHGRGRPIPPPQPTEDHGLDRWDSGWVDRFWALNDRYGYWGLAFLETVFRLANHCQAESDSVQEEA